MKFSGKMCYITILKVTKNQGFTISLEIHFSRNHGGEGQIDPPTSPPSRSRVKDYFFHQQ